MPGSFLRFPVNKRNVVGFRIEQSLAVNRLIICGIEGHYFGLIGAEERRRRTFRVTLISILFSTFEKGVLIGMLED